MTVVAGLEKDDHNAAATLPDCNLYQWLPIPNPEEDFFYYYNCALRV